MVSPTHWRYGQLDLPKGLGWVMYGGSECEQYLRVQEGLVHTQNTFSDAIKSSQVSGADTKAGIISCWRTAPPIS